MIDVTFLIKIRIIKQKQFIMKTITAYKLNNGEVFESKSDAEFREQELIINERIRILCDELMYRGMDADDICDVITENKEKFIHAFNLK